MKNLRRGMCVLVTAVALLPFGRAVTATESEHREHEAHEHGHGTLNVVVEGNEMIIEFEIPAVNVLGFEHAPGTDKERQAIEQARATFGRGDLLFIPTRAAGCRAGKSQVELTGMEHETAEGHTQEGHGQGSPSEPTDSKSGVHSELRGEYHFHCSAPKNLESLEVRLFDHLKDVEDIDVQIVTPTIQTSLELQAESPLLALVPS